MLHAVIMAGGSGQRFWPLSRQSKPKQFLALVGGRTMLQLTVERLNGLVRPENIIVISGAGYAETVREQLPQIPFENIVLEPCGRDTAAAVGMGALYVLRRDPEGVMVVLPADHYIADIKLFQSALVSATTVAAKGDWLVTMGINPTRPDTGYGYICRGEMLDTFSGLPVYKVVKFTEKPDQQTACNFLSLGNYLWNSGIFVWRADLINKLINKYIPLLASGLAEINKVLYTESEKEVLCRLYTELPRISIDYGIMEKVENVLVVPGVFGWDDVGSWPALERCREVEENGNIVEARGVFLETTGCIIYAPGRLIATLGIENLVLVDDGECIMVCSKEKAQDLKKIIAALKENGLEHVL